MVLGEIGLRHLALLRNLIDWNCIYRSIIVLLLESKIVIGDSLVPNMIRVLSQLLSDGCKRPSRLLLRLILVESILL